MLIYRILSHETIFSIVGPPSGGPPNLKSVLSIRILLESANFRYLAKTVMSFVAPPQSSRRGRKRSFIFSHLVYYYSHRKNSILNPRSPLNPKKWFIENVCMSHCSFIVASEPLTYICSPNFESKQYRQEKLISNALKSTSYFIRISK